MSDPRQVIMRNGRIVSTSIGVLAARHCNLSCRACVTLSPTLPPSFADPDEVFRDLGTLGRVYHARAARVRGGEPLLHPALGEVLAAVRRSGVADRIAVVTNGVLLSQMPGSFWEAVDEVRVSAYPQPAFDRKRLDDWRERACGHGVDLIVLHVDRFRETYAEAGTSDERLVRRLYATCEDAHVLRCHGVSGGIFYKCDQGWAIAAARNSDDAAGRPMNGVEISEAPAFAERLLAYLESRDPLSACRFCLGSAGRLFSHELVPRARWAAHQSHSTEQLLDPEHLSRLERGHSGAYLRCVREVTLEAFHGHSSRLLRFAVGFLSRRPVRGLLSRQLEDAIRSYRDP